MKTETPIRIGLDFHGVVDKYPEYFSRFTHIAKQMGIEIYIITGGPKKVVDRFLQDHKIVYKELFAILDYYDAQGMVEYYKNGEYKVPDNKVMVMHTLVIDPKVQKSGLGRAFVEFYEKYSLEQGCPYLRMDTNAKNTNARNLYKKLGYKEIGIVPCAFNGIDGVNLVLLEKKIGN